MIVYISNRFKNLPKSRLEIMSTEYKVRIQNTLSKYKADIEKSLHFYIFATNNSK